MHVSSFDPLSGFTYIMFFLHSLLYCIALLEQFCFFKVRLVAYLHGFLNPGGGQNWGSEKFFPHQQFNQYSSPKFYHYYVILSY